MKNKEIQNESRMIRSEELWMHVYHRDEKTCYLCNFCPTGANGMLTKLERILDIEEVAMFQDVGMSFIITNRNAGVPVYDLSKIMASFRKEDEV